MKGDNNTQLLDEFRNHADKLSEVPTALVSVSSRIVDTLNRAIYLYLVAGEHPCHIWIAFIEIPAATSSMASVIVHLA